MTTTTPEEGAVNIPPAETRRACLVAHIDAIYAVAHREGVYRVDVQDLVGRIVGDEPSLPPLADAARDLTQWAATVAHAAAHDEPLTSDGQSILDDLAVAYIRVLNAADDQLRR